MNYTTFDIATMPEVRSNDVTLIQRDGLWAGDDYIGGRTIALSLQVQAVDVEEFNAANNLIQRAFTPGVSGESKLAFRIPGMANGREAYVNVRTRRRSAPLDASFARLSCAYEVELFATDPYIYAEQETAVTLRKGVPALVPVDGSLPAEVKWTMSGTSEPAIRYAATGDIVISPLTPGPNFLVLDDNGTNAAATARTSFRDRWV
ncbi:hypothetical protein ABZ905_36945 [Streptomyces parvus]|uniref:hypothetical protein n=1 Tax=Streptomyces parvus TaxID=66428 RepID=UPI0033E337C2